MASRVRRTVAAFGLFGLAAVCAVAALVGAVVAGYDLDEAIRVFVLPQAVIGVSFAVSGVLIAWQRPGNPVGWLVLSAGCVQTATAAAVPWVDIGVRDGWPEVVLRGLATVYAYAWPWGISLCVPLALLLFPDGTLPGRRWRPVVWLVVAGSVFFVAALGGEGAQLKAPLARAWFVVPGYDDLDTLWLVAKIANVLVNAVVLASLVVRYRAGDAVLRRQVRWLLLAALLSAAALVPQPLFGVGPVLLFLALAFIPVAIMFAVLRYRLFDIDLVVRRSLVYGVLSLGITATYAALAAAPGLTLGSRIPVELAVALTIVAAVAFQPVRRRLDALADRWVFGPRVNRYQLLTAFGAGLEQTLDLRELLPELAATVRRGLAASWVRVSLPGTAALAGEPDGRTALEVPLERNGESVGRIECGAKDGGYDPDDVQLLTTLAGQAATAIANVRLTAELARRLEELSRSRARIVAAQDSERRRIERDLHDGAQQHVVALITKLRLVRNQLARGERSADKALDELQADARELLADLRDLAHGIHPPVLSDRGLVAAVEARADRLPLDIVVHAEPALYDRRFGAAVEAAAYFTVCEALTNVVKHARTDAARIALTVTDGHLAIVVHDDGVGFPGTVTAGRGLTNLRDRIETLDGTMHIEGRAGAGTRLRAEIPIGGTP
ncbi:histidine kinase [Phytohabitans sp. LJ34]|uniref:GAF domain-containing sensor histidine kinase n=1 Tax=Phytohabitans sp. LJ34 TaxID=3452217 RepID=UPI003F8A1535